MRAAGYEVLVATPPAEEVEQIVAEGFSFYPITLQRQGINPFREVITLLSVMRLFRELKPDLVHNFTSKPVIYGTLAARFIGIKAVVNSLTGLGRIFIDGENSSSLRSIVIIAYRMALHHSNMAMIFQNPDDERIFLCNRILPADTMTVIKGSGVDITTFVPEAYPDAARPVVILAARMLWEKGVGEFVEAAKQLQAQGIQASFRLIGDPDDSHKGSISAEQLRAWHDSGVVTWEGYRTDMPHVFAEANIVCLPSYYREGVPKVLGRG